MTNTNRLEGLKCPECGQEDEFYITATSNFIVHDEGTSEFKGDVEWDDDNSIECPACHLIGIVHEFRFGERKPRLDTIWDFVNVVAATDDAISDHTAGTETLLTFIEAARRLVLQPRPTPDQAHRVMALTLEQIANVCRVNATSQLFLTAPDVEDLKAHWNQIAALAVKAIKTANQMLEAST